VRASVLLAFTTLISATAYGQTWVFVEDSEWDPDPPTVADVVRSVETAFSQAAREQPEDVPSWDTYTIQYRGRLSDGERVIEVSGVCSDIAERMKRTYDLKKVFVGVADGGPCAFRATYDARAKRLVQFLFNGVA
jgi:hypothetical protein